MPKEQMEVTPAAELQMMLLEKDIRELAHEIGKLDEDLRDLVGRKPAKSRKKGAK